MVDEGDGLYTITSIDLTSDGDGLFTYTGSPWDRTFQSQPVAGHTEIAASDLDLWDRTFQSQPVAGHTEIAASDLDQWDRDLQSQPVTGRTEITTWGLDLWDRTFHPQPIAGGTQIAAISLPWVRAFRSGPVAGGTQIGSLSLDVPPIGSVFTLTILAEVGCVRTVTRVFTATAIGGTAIRQSSGSSRAGVPVAVRGASYG